MQQNSKEEKKVCGQGTQPSVLKEENNPNLLKLKLQNLGHLTRTADSLEKTLMLGKIEGRRGRKRMRWLDSVRLNGHEFEQTPGNTEGQGSLACCGPRGRKESDTTERLNHSKTYSHQEQPPVTQRRASVSPMFETIYLENTEHCPLGDHPRFLLSFSRVRELARAESESRSAVSDSCDPVDSAAHGFSRPL